MELKDAQDLILRAVENPAANVPSDQLSIAIATVLVRNELLGAKPTQVNLNVLTTGE